MNNSKFDYFSRIFGSQSIIKYWGSSNCDAATLLQKNPEHSTCNWDAIDGRTWVELLKKIPDLAPYCRWQKFSGRDWVDLLETHPQFAYECSWSKLLSADWVALLEKQPQFEKEYSKILLKIRISR